MCIFRNFQISHPFTHPPVSHSSFQALEDSPSYDDLRAEAALHAKLRSEAFQKAARARSLRQGEVAVYYALKVGPLVCGNFTCWMMSSCVLCVCVCVLCVCVCVCV